MGSQDRRASESTAFGHLNASGRLPFTRTTSDVAVSQATQKSIRRSSEQEQAMRRASQQDTMQMQHQYSQTQRIPPVLKVQAGSPISRPAKLRRSPSPQIPGSGLASRPSFQIPQRYKKQPTEPKRHVPRKRPITLWLQSFTAKAGTAAMDACGRASRDPPITAQSLAELDTACILNNPKLRHDINFDRELHFRPNLDGDRGKAKMEKADEYWQCLEVELERYAFMLMDPAGQPFRSSPEFLDEMRQVQPRTPRMFTMMRAILLKMNEKSDMPGVQEAVDVELIMQQIERGTFDLPALADFLATLLKSHCAPMRDAWVAKVAELMKTGWQSFDFKMVVLGFRELFSLLESMKLDIANHQIRHLRPMLLDSTVNFERTYFNSRLNEGHIDTQAARRWYQGSEDVDVRMSEPRSSPENPALKQFLTRFLDSLIKPATSKHMPSLPETFKLDLDRLLLLRADVHTMAYMSICTDALTQIMREHRRPIVHQSQAIKHLNETLPVILGRGASEARWVLMAGHVAAEILRVAHGNFTGTGLELVVVPYMTETSAAIEKFIQGAVRQESPQFSHAVSTLLPILAERVNCLTQKHRDASSQDLVEAFVPRSAQSAALESKRTRKFNIEMNAAAAVSSNALAPFEDAARRAAHICILHWRVWADMVYLEEDDDDEEFDEE